jgi:hypothetical protein
MHPACVTKSCLWKVGSLTLTVLQRDLVWLEFSQRHGSELLESNQNTQVLSQVRQVVQQHEKISQRLSKRQLKKKM